MKWPLALLALSTAACDSRPDQWDAFVYPDRDDLSKHEEIAGFKTFELCQQAAIGRLRTLPDPDTGDYECGYKCEPRADLDGVNVCKETRK
ncbi:hypothetical protein [Sphingobium sp.]|uniref:hypothetical protein n=1 Tax=Sphingobium sp. TaxID=1912891 RepID=UPI0028BE74C9|nr:hypothetical protein [Sphingobium sp.]